MRTEESNRGLGGMDPERALRSAWIIWAMLLLGVAAFAGVVFLGGVAPSAAPGAPQADLLRWLPLGMLAMTFTAGFLLRAMLWSKAEKDGRVPPGVWATGNIVLWALLEGPAFFGLVVVMLEGPSGGRIVAPAAAFLGMVVTSPASSAGRLIGS